MQETMRVESETVSIKSHVALPYRRSERQDYHLDLGRVLIWQPDA